jgi:hypothetical protein
MDRNKTENEYSTSNAIFTKSPDQIYVNNMGGGFKLFDFGGDSFTKAIKRTKSSENKLINNYVDMDKVVKDYHKSYDTHLKNLEKLDDYANFHGMENLFKKVIMKDAFKNGKVDKSKQILFRNYLIEEETTPNAFRKEHIMRQINYVLDTYFAGREHMFIKHMRVDVGKHKFILYITTIENIKKSREISHKDFVISTSETKKALKDILETTKKNLKRKSKLVEFNSRRSSNSSSSSSFSKSTKKKSPKSSSSRYGKTKSRTKKKNSNSKSINNLSIFNKSNNTNKKSRNSSSKNNLPSNINIGTEKSRNSTKKEKLDIYKTPSEKEKEAAVKAIPQATAFGAPLQAPIFAPAFGQPPAIEQRKQDLLGQPGMNFQQPAPMVQQPGMQIAPAPGQATNNAAIRQKCISHQTLDECKADLNCFFSKNANKCFKRDRPQGEYSPPPRNLGGFGAITPFGAQSPPAQVQSPPIPVQAPQQFTASPLIEL